MTTRLPAAWRERKDWVPLDTPAGRWLRNLRWAAIAGYLGVLIWYASTIGLPFDRTGLLLWVAVGLLACCIGKHPVWLLWVVIDFVPLAAVLFAYDRLRGLSYTLGMPTWWHPQIDIDRFLFAGHEPTVWLQEHLKHVSIQWYDVVVAVCYFSFFFLPYLLAGIMWLRSRRDFYRWTGRFVSLSFLGFALFVLIPAAPPWAAARCTAADVANHPNNPVCMYYGDQSGGGLLGRLTHHQPGAHPYVELITTRGFVRLHLGVADSLINQGRGYIDAVAAVPSLHVGGTVLFVLFMWKRANRWWRIPLAIYPFLMMFSLAYGGDHYVADGIAGALCAWLVHWAAGRVERRIDRRRNRRAAADTLGTEPETETLQEIECPPNRPQPANPDPALPHATMPSST